MFHFYKQNLNPIFIFKKNKTNNHHTILHNSFEINFQVEQYSCELKS